jgi:hypothetical protein
MGGGKAAKRVVLVEAQGVQQRAGAGQQLVEELGLLSIWVAWEVGRGREAEALENSSGKPK